MVAQYHCLLWALFSYVTVSQESENELTLIVPHNYPTAIYHLIDLECVLCRVGVLYNINMMGENFTKFFQNKGSKVQPVNNMNLSKP